MKPQFVYVASSWRNFYQPGVVYSIRELGIDCYDFRHPTTEDTGFSWREIDPNWENWQPFQWRDALRHPIAKAGFKSDRDALERADCVVLVLPCGRSAHLEAAWAAGRGVRVITYVPESVEPELMQLLLGPPEAMCTSIHELEKALL